jgi:hypothetical protein
VHFLRYSGVLSGTGIENDRARALPGLTGTVISTSKVVWWMCHCAQLQLPPITGRRVVLTDNVSNLVCGLSDQSG